MRDYARDIQLIIVILLGIAIIIGLLLVSVQFTGKVVNNYKERSSKSGEPTEEEVTTNKVDMYTNMVKAVRDIETARYSNITETAVREIEVNHMGIMTSDVIGKLFVLDEGMDGEYRALENEGYYSERVTVKPLQVGRKLYDGSYYNYLGEEETREKGVYYTIYARTDLVLRSDITEMGTGKYEGSVNAIYDFNEDGHIVGYRRGISWIKPID